MKEDTNTLGKKDLRDFGLITGGVVAGLFGLLLPWLFSRAFPLWPWVFGAVLAIFALFLPTTLKPVYRGWMAFGHVAGWINTRIILGILFFLIFLPVGLVMRLFGRDPMARKLDGNESTFRVPSHSLNSEQIRRPY